MDDCMDVNPDIVDNFSFSLAHLSWRAIVIAICRPSSIRPLNNFSSETPGPIFFKLHVEPSAKGDWKFVQMVMVHQSRLMTAMPIYGKNF